eukprot:UN32688
MVINVNPKNTNKKDPTERVFSDEEILMKQRFDLFDINHDGKITLDELKKVMKEMREDYDVSAQDYMTMIDTNKDGYITFEEFCAVMLTPHDNGNEFKDAFNAFDNDGDGSISEDEFMQAAKFLDKNLTEKDMKSMFKMADVDNSGAIDFDEFMSMMM